MDEKTEKILRDLASKLGTTTEKLYSVLVAQAKVELVGKYISLIIWVIWIIILFYFNKAITWDSTNETIFLNTAVPFVLVWIGNIVSVLSTVLNAGVTISTIVGLHKNPEYFAINKIIETLTPIV